MLFTDGQDSASWLENEDVLQAARESSALLHVVGTEPLPAQRSARRSVLPPAAGSSRERRSTESGYVYLLRRAAETTGGAYWPVESIASLPAAFLRILEASAARYVLRYEPTGVPRAGRHRLKVSVRRRGVEVRARQEYTVPGRAAAVSANGLSGGGRAAQGGSGRRVGPVRMARRAPDASRWRTATAAAATEGRWPRRRS